MKVLERPSTIGHSETIDLGVRRRPRRFPWRIVIAIVAVIAIAATAVVLMRRPPALAYTTQPVSTGSLVQTITATGTLNAQDTVSVGSQVSGTIAELNVDFNSTVKKGDVLARLDPSTFQAALASAQAQLAQSEAQAQAQAATASGSPANAAASQEAARAAAASVLAAAQTARSNAAAIASADANVTKTQSALALAQQTMARDQQLVAQGYIAQNQVDTDRSNLAAAQSADQSAQAAATQARAQAAASSSQLAASQAQAQQQTDQASVAQSQVANTAASAQAAQAAIGIQRANVATAEQNLQKTVITAPVDGTVISRAVSVGQTVAASLQTPTLFTIAKDLKKMQVDVAVGEPDIGSVKAGEVVDFSVLAYPNQTFHGVVSQVRQNPTTVNNVVTYDTVVLVNNVDGRLRPGMTANASIHVSTLTGATIVPLQALQYQPPAGSIAHRAHRTPNGTTASAPWGGAGLSASGGVVTAGSNGRVFLQRANGLQPVPVHVEMVSGAQAAVTPLRGALHAGDAVVIADSSSASGSTTRRTSRTNGDPFAGGPGLGGPPRLGGGGR